MDEIVKMSALKECAERAKEYADAGARAVSVTIPTAGWVNGSGMYPKYYDIAVTGVTANDRADITISAASLGTAKACGMCPTSETLAGKVRVRAATVPSAAMTAECLINFKAKE